MTSENRDDSANNYIGKRIANYLVTDKLGSGSSSDVYRGTHIFLIGRTVAIKLFDHIRLGSSQEREGFLQEAQLLEQLNHPHILSIIDAGIENNFPYLVTEYAPGGSLGVRLKRQDLDSLSIQESLTILQQIGKALQFAHQQNIVHRDLKPGNILFDARGNVLLADFGIAAMLDTANTGSSVSIEGTPSYMAPEQFQGVLSKTSDQYSLGCIAYELFTGRKPFRASDFFTFMYKHTMEIPLAPTQFKPDLPVNIEQAILKAMAKRREDRFADIASFIAALSGVPISRSPSQNIEERTLLNIPREFLPILHQAGTLPISTCPYCSVETQPEDKFCSNCGSLLQPVADPYDPTNLRAAVDFTVVSNSPITTEATDYKIENPAIFTLRNGQGEILQEYPLQKSVIHIGCIPTSDIGLPGDKLVSPLHASIRYENGSYVLQDEHSANGTFVNGQQLEDATPYYLKNADHIGIGKYEFIFKLAMATALMIEDLPTVVIPFSKPNDAATIGTRFMTSQDDFHSIPVDSVAAEVSVNWHLAGPDALALAQSPPSPHSTTPFEQTINHLFEEAEVYYKAKRYEDALTIYRRIVQLDSRNVDAHGKRGNILGKRGKYKEALAAYNIALDINANHASIWNAKGDILVKLRRYEEALVAYDESLALNVQNISTWRAKGNTLSKLKRYEEGLLAYGQALTLDANDTETLAVQGHALAALDRYEEALAAYDCALAITPKKALFWDAKGDILSKIQHYEESLEAYNRALALSPYNKAIDSKCSMLQKVLNHLKEKQIQDQINEKLAQTQAADPSNTKASGVNPTSVDQPKMQQVVYNTQSQGAHQPFQHAVDSTRVIEYDIFLVHSSADAQWVERNLAARLEDDFGFRVWLDQWALIPGESWQTALARGIDQAHCCAVCIGEQASTGWFQQVIQKAKNRQVHDSSFRVIPVLLPNAADINIDDFLELNAIVDFRESNFSRMLHILVCGVKGVPPGRPVSEETTYTRSRTLAKEMLLDLQQLRDDNLIPDPVKDEYTRITMEKVWLVEWTLKEKDNNNE